MISFDVDYYDDAEKDAFRRSGADEQLGPLVEKGLSIDEFDLISRGMFMEQKNKVGWKSRDDLAHKALTRIDQFEQYFETSRGSLAAQHDAAEMGGNTEWMGVGASIAAMDEAFKTNDADWEKIPVSNTKDMDFHVASTGSRMVVVECKGSVVHDPLRKSPAISSHKHDIKEKKQAQRSRRPNDVLIGTVTAIPINADQRARIWLVDPPAPDSVADPRKFKLLARLRYYQKLLRVLGRPHIGIALATRIAALEKLSNVGELDGAGLLTANGTVFGVPPSFIQSRSHSVDERLAVAAWPSRSGLFVVGMDLAAIGIVARQKHGDILEWNSRLAGRRTQDFVLLLDPRLGDRLGLRRAGHLRQNGLLPFRALLDVSTSRSGLVFGRFTPTRPR